MYTISKQFTFSASHQLVHLPAKHKCARMHGHNYVVVVEARSDVLDKDGFVVDFGDFGKLKEFIDRRLDHRHLNDVMGEILGIVDANACAVATTAESLARTMYGRFVKLHPNLVAVRVSETPKTWAEWRPE